MKSCVAKGVNCITKFPVLFIYFSNITMLFLSFFGLALLYSVGKNTSIVVYATTLHCYAPEYERHL